MKKNIYVKTQYGLLLNILMSLSVFLIYAIYQNNSNSTSSMILWLTIGFMLIIWLLMYKLTILIDKESITAIFGIGLLKRKVSINEIDFSTLKVVVPSKFTGIGIRLTPLGWLWNVKFGKAIYFKTKNGKTFFVGTDEPEKIIAILLKLKNNSSWKP